MTKPSSGWLPNTSDIEQSSAEHHTSSQPKSFQSACLLLSPYSRLNFRIEQVEKTKWLARTAMSWLDLTRMPHAHTIDQNLYGRPRGRGARVYGRKYARARGRTDGLRTCVQTHVRGHARGRALVRACLCTETRTSGQTMRASA